MLRSLPKIHLSHDRALCGSHAGGHGEAVLAGEQARNGILNLELFHNGAKAREH